MSNAPELPAELFAQLWGEALQLYPDARVVPGLACTEVARMAYFAGWEARAAVKDSLTTAEDSSVAAAPPADQFPGATQMVPPPAEGEVAELVAWLEKHYEYANELGRPDWAQNSRRAAALIQQQGSDSDGYHTLAELYEHRYSLMLALMRAVPNLCWFSQRHSDGGLPFDSGEWFIVGADFPTGSITYHLPIAMLELAQQTGAAELTTGRPWDGHNADDVSQRLRQWAALPLPSEEVGGMNRPMGCAASGQLSLGVAESFPPGDDEIKAWADSCDYVPPETLVDEAEGDDGYGLIFRPAQFYETVRAALARWGRPAPPPADPIRTALERPLERLDETREPGDPVIPPWIDSYAAARAVLAAAPSDGQRGATEEELQEARRGVATLTPAAVADRLLHLGQVQARQAREHSAALCERAAELLLAPPAAEGELVELVELAALVSIAAGVCAHDGYHDEARACRRAAALIQQQAAKLERLRLVPVPVSDRPWERDGWCDDDGWCWFGWTAPPGHPPDSSWSFCRPSERDTATVSLPAHALPLPSGGAPMAELNPGALAGELLLAYRRGTIWESYPDPFGLAAALEFLALQDETLFDVRDGLAPVVRAVRTDRILAIAAELRGGANG